MFKARLVLMIVLAAFVMAPVQAVVLDNMDNIAARPWTDDRDGPAQGTGWLSQGTDPCDGGNGVMKIDYGVTYDGAGVSPYNQPHPLSGWDYLGNWVGVGAPGGAFDEFGTAISQSNPGAGVWQPGYLGDFDRLISATFAPGELCGISTAAWFELDVYKTVANSPEYVRELHLYDSLGNVNVYTVQVEADACSIGQGWKTYIIPLNAPDANNADLADIVTVKLFVSSWSAFVFQNFENPVWPGDYTIVRPTGTPVLIDNLRLIPEPAVVSDNMDNIAARPWVDDRDTLDQARPGWMSQGADPCDGGNGVMKIDYGVTNDSNGVPDPCSGYDYLGNFVGVGAAGGAFDVNGTYLGDFDRVPSATFAPGEIPCLTSDYYFTLDVYKTIANSPEHVRELQLYDSLGNRSLLTVQAVADAPLVGQGWKTYAIPLSSLRPEGVGADLSDIVTVKLWVSSWSAFVFQNFENPTWPDDYIVERPTGTPVLIDDLQLVLCPAAEAQELEYVFPTPEDQIRIVCWNIEFLGIRSPLRTQEQLDAIAERILTFDAAVLALQERADVSTSEYIRSQLGPSWKLYPYSGNWNALLYDENKVEMLSVELLDTLDNPPYTPYPSGRPRPVSGVFRPIGGTESFRVIGVHCYGAQIPAEGEWLRAKIIEFLENPLEPNDIILLGDLNGEPGFAPHPQLQQGGYIYPLPKENGDVTHVNGSNIDWFYVTPPVIDKLPKYSTFVIRPGHYDETPEEFKATYSDHLPVFSNYAFILPAEKSVENLTTGQKYYFIQPAIDLASSNSGHVIEVGESVYHENINLHGKNILVRSTNPDDMSVVKGTVIDANGMGSVVTFSGDEDASCSLSGFTITGGNSQDGGGIKGNGTGASISNCIVTGNSAAGWGGGIYRCNGIISDCLISGNTASNNGGGMYNNSGSPTVANCTFNGNIATNFGGGMHNWSSSPTVTNCTFSGNSADYGGGMSNRDCSSPTVTNCTFSGNSADYGGGMLSSSSSSSPTVINCILWGNTASDGNEIALFSSSTMDVNYCDVQGGQAGIYNDGGTINWGSGNIDADPMFFDALNPDPNLRDYHLRPGSPCIDAGDNTALPADTADLDNDGDTAEPIPYDLDEHPRIVDGDCNSTEVVDMGAYEFAWIYVGDFAGGCDVDFIDFAVLALAWYSEVGDGNWNEICDISVPNDNVIDELDLEVFAENWLAGL